MDFVDSATGTAHAGHGATVKGQQEAQVGVSNMENPSTQNAAGAAPAAAQTVPTTTQTAAGAMPSEKSYLPSSNTGY